MMVLVVEGEYFMVYVIAFTDNIQPEVSVCSHPAIMPDFQTT